MKASVTKTKVINILIKWGNNESDTANMVEKYFDWVARIYEGQDLTTGKVAEIIRSIY